MNKEEIKNVIVEVLKNNGIKKASIFGSYSTNNFTDESDIDILIEFNDDNKSLLDLIGIKQELEQRLNKRIDLITFNSINPKIKNYILSQEELLYG